MKYLCLDIGNVITRVSFEQFTKKLSNKLNISEKQVDYFLNRTQRLHDMGLTNISDELRDHFQIKSDTLIEELMIEWNTTITRDEYMNGVLKDLIRKANTTESSFRIDNGLSIALLSNIGPEHTLLMRDMLTPEVYDNCIPFFSCAVGARKPSYLYYKTFLDMYPAFTGALYIDDRMENIETGRKLGLNAMHFSLDDANKLSLTDKNTMVMKLFEALDI